MNDCGHQTQYASGALESIQATPFVIEPLEKFRVDGISSLHLLPVVAFTAAMRKFCGIILIEMAITMDNCIAFREVMLLGDRLKQAATHDLETFLGRCRLPSRFHAAESVLQTIQSVTATLAPNLDIRGW